MAVLDSVCKGLGSTSSRQRVLQEREKITGVMFQYSRLGTCKMGHAPSASNMLVLWHREILIVTVKECHGCGFVYQENSCFEESYKVGLQFTKC